MDNKTKKVLEAMKPLRSAGDVVYVIMRQEKKSFLFHIWDTFVADTILSTVSDMQHKVMYLLASDNGGKIIDVSEGMVIEIIQIPNWAHEDKEHFKKVIIDCYTYKKIEKMNV